MDKNLLVVIMLLFSIGLYAQQKTNKIIMNEYSSEWKKVEQLDEENLPKSAKEEADKILQQAIAEKNTPQVIKALIFKNKYEIAINSDNNVLIFSDLEKLVGQTASPSDKALLHSMLGELYLRYYQRNSWNINNRTELADYIPEDIKEWSKNIFYDKAIYHFNLSTEDINVTLNTTTKAYKDIIDLGGDSEEYYPSLYDFIMNRNIDLSASITSGDLNNIISKSSFTWNDINGFANTFTKINLGNNNPDYNVFTLKLYQLFMSSLLERNMTNTLVLTELNKVSYLSDRSSIYNKNYKIDVLLAFQQKYNSNPVSVEIVKQIADYYISNDNSYTYSDDGSETSDNRTKAYEWLTKGIEQYPDYKRTNILKRTLEDLEEPYAQISGENGIFHPDKKDKKVTLRYKGINKVTVNIKKKEADGNYKSYKKYDVDLNPLVSYSYYTQDINLDIPDMGTYKIYLNFENAIEDQDPFEVSISHIATFVRNSSEKEYEFYVVDRMNGNPIKDATINVFNENKIIKTISTDKLGFATYTSDINLNTDYSVRSNYRYEVYTKDDNPYLKNNFPYSYIFRNKDKTEAVSSEKINIFTDRSIYRPGQIMYYKVVAVNSQGDDLIPISKNSYSVKLYDTNNQLLTEQTLSTNEFGSIAGQFSIPLGRSTGSYCIEVNKIREYVSVEEYKRPTFQVTFDKIDKTYSFGDKVTLTGRVESFSGVKLQDANVDYYITKSSYWGWRGSSESIENGTVTSKGNGSFEITFIIPQKDYEYTSLWENIYSFNVSATVTDINGETQSGDYSFAVGSVSMILSSNIPDKLNKKDNNDLEIKAANLNGQDISTSGTYTIYKDTTKNEVLKSEFTTGKQSLLKTRIQGLPSGRYTIKLQSKDSNGKEVEVESIFVLYSDNDKKPPIETDDWVINKNTKFDINKPAEIVLGISAKNITVLYELIKEEKVHARQQIKFNDENKTFSIPYKAEYQDGVDAVFTYMIDGKVYQKVVPLTKEKAEKQLKLKMEVFRDKLRPGQKEEWRISVKDNMDKPAFAELLASMYDTSLDKIKQANSWSFSRLFTTKYNRTVTFSLNNNSNVYGWYSFKNNKTEYPVFSFDEIKWFGFDFNYDLYITLRKAKVKSNSSDNIEFSSSWGQTGITGKVAGVVSAAPESIPVEQGFLAENSTVSKEDAVVDNNDATPQIRQNFNETAFFYPQLRTDENGETIISFTVPESNTTWKFRAIAYDKSLNIGSLEAITMTRKELMVTPNLPRFMRQGDKTTISTKISNLSEGNISGNVRIEFFDPLTDKLIDLAIDNQSQAFSIAKDASASVQWLFEVPSETDMIGCRIVAGNESFSDGEQHVISVLPNRMLITESMPVNVNGIGKKQFVFDKLANNKSASLSNYRLTLEYSSNPAWYAIQALPVFNNPTNENVVNWFASYYVNVLGGAINIQYPKVSSMINTWKKHGENKEAITSKLMQNEELKSVLLEETPWVLDAKDENEQIERLSLLLDLNNSKYQQTAATDKLKELQNSDGGWSWYKGFRSSRSITQYILYGYTELINLNAVQYSSDIKVMQMNALKFIDKEIRSDFENLKKNNKDWEKLSSVSTSQLEYIFVRSGYRDIPIDQETHGAERFYTTVAENNWTKLNLHQQSLLAMVTKRNGNKTLSDKIMKSLREHATIDNEKGMFWANNKSNVFMSLSAVSTHVFLMDAFKETGSSDKEMNLMKLWLLKQKQTQLWESTHASIDAIYALLSTGSDWFSGSGDVNIKIGQTQLNTESKQAGSGYFKETWNKEEITNRMATVEVENKRDVPSFGAVYWQYYEDLDKISSQKDILNVDKNIFIESTSGNGKSLNQVTENNPLKVGDKAIIRLTVRVERDMDFVQIKDMRASCFEPVSTISGTSWKDRTMYYQSTKDASTNFYFDHLPKGTYVFEYPVYVTRNGEYSNGITTIQCMYAPEFISHTAGITVKVK